MNNRYSIFFYLVQFISMQGMEHPQRLIIANRKRHKITDIESRLHKLPTDEINIFTLTPLKDALMCKNHRIVQVVCGDFDGNVKAISYYPENEFVQWYFKENAIEQVVPSAQFGEMIDLNTQLHILSFALYKQSNKKNYAQKCYDSLRKPASGKNSSYGLLLGMVHLLLYGVVGHCLLKTISTLKN